MDIDVRALLSRRINIAIIAGAVLLLLLPLILRHEYWIYVFTIGYYYAILALTWNIMAGYLRRVSFAHMALAAIGAYTSTLTIINFKIPLVLGMFLGMVVGALSSLFIGYLSLRLRGVYFTLSTLAFAEIFRIVVTVEYQYTRGSLGLEAPKLLGNILTYVPYYYVALAFLGAVTILTHLMLNSGLGLRVKAVGDSEEAAEALGINSARIKVFTFLYSSAIASLAGAFYGHLIGLVSPEICGFEQLALVIAMSVVGGLGTIPGPIIGALLIELLAEYLRGFGIYRYLILAALIIVTIRFFRQGIFGWVKKRVLLGVGM